MKSTVTLRGMALALVIVFIGASLLFYLFLYRPKVVKVARGTSEISRLKEKLEKIIQENNKIKEDIDRISKEKVNVDYFRRYQIPPNERTPTFLAMVNDVVNRLGIKTVMVKPLDQEESSEHIRYPFLVEAKSKYQEIVKFVDSLENSFGLNLDDVHVENDPKDPLWRRFKFTVSTFESKRPESPPSDKKGNGEGSTIQPPEVRDDIVVKRDPFLEQEKRLKERIIPKKRLVRRLPRLKLNAIIDIAGRKIAIINDTIVREGDWVAKHRILRIDEDKVILEYRGKERVLEIEDLVKTKKG